MGTIETNFTLILNWGHCFWGPKAVFGSEWVASSKGVINPSYKCVKCQKGWVNKHSSLLSKRNSISSNINGSYRQVCQTFVQKLFLWLSSREPSSSFSEAAIKIKQDQLNKKSHRSIQHESWQITTGYSFYLGEREGGGGYFLSFCKNTRSSNLCLALSLNLYGLYPSEHLNCEWFDNAMIYLPQLNTNYFLKQYWVLMGVHQLSVVVPVPDFGKKLNFLNDLALN